ncbi:MAG: serine/threonine-protein kinase [Planctomycetota bacterium]|nr:serine/threonine-protein kinase [Planctomycetota bacterium]
MSDDDLIGSEMAGCTITRLIGRGGIGAVYEATHAERGARMAIKVLAPQSKDFEALNERFEREARLCFQLSHPNVIRVHTWGALDDGRHYMVMDLVDGTTLSQMIRKHKRLSWDVAASIIADIAEALEHVHALDIVHRDIKPANILVDRAGRGILADLGLARQLVDSLDEKDGRRLTAPGSALGSPAYMPPEQITDTSTAAVPADLYSLGASLYHAITGRPPLLANTPSGTIMRVLKDLPIALGELDPAVPTALSQLVDDCLDKDPGNRPNSAALFASLLRDELRAAGHQFQ